MVGVMAKMPPSALLAGLLALKVARAPEGLSGPPLVRRHASSLLRRGTARSVWGSTDDVVVVELERLRRVEVQVIRDFT